MVTNKELEVQVAELVARVDELEEFAGATTDTVEAVVERPGFDDSRFDDLLAAVMAALVRSRSQGAMLTAKALADKYLPEGTDIQSYGEAFVTASGLYSSGKKE